MSDLFGKFTVYDIPDKYVVIKVDHLEDRLNEKEQDDILKILRKLKNKNKYWVVNKDEPYAEKVKKLIFSDGDKEG